MSERMSIMKLEPMSNVERRLATVVLADEERIFIEPADFGNDREYWARTLSEIVGIDPVAHPRAFFEALPERLDGTYVYARAEVEALEADVVSNAVSA